MGSIGKLSVLAGVILWPGSAAADPLGDPTDGYVLWVNASPSARDCPAAPELGQRIAARLKSNPFVDAVNARRALHVSFTREGPTYHAFLSVRTASDATRLERHFEAPANRCTEVAEASVLGATLLIEGAADVTATDGDHGIQAPAPVTTADTTDLNRNADSALAVSTQRRSINAAAAPSAASLNATDTDVTAPQTTQTSHASASHYVGSEWWLMPVVSRGVVSNTGVAWGMGLSGLLLARQPFGVSWGADYIAAESFVSSQTRYRFSQSTAFVDAALRLPLASRVSLTPELGAMFGVTHAAVITHDPTDPGDFPFLGLHGGARLGFRLIGPLALGASGHVRIPFSRHVFRADGVPDAVWRQSSVGYTAELALGLAFH